MNRDEKERMGKLLQEALPRVNADAEPARDLWPAVLHRLDERQTMPWLDVALAGGLVALVALFPAAIPVFLYYL